MRSRRRLLILSFLLVFLTIPTSSRAGSDAWGGKAYSLGTGKADSADVRVTQPLRDRLKADNGWTDAQANAKIALMRANLAKAVVLAKKSMTPDCAKYLQKQFDNGNVCVGIGIEVLGYAQPDKTTEKKESEKITVRAASLCKADLKDYDPELLEIVETIVHEIQHTGQAYLGIPYVFEAVGKSYAENEVAAHGANASRQAGLRNLLCDSTNVIPGNPFPVGTSEADKCVLKAIREAPAGDRQAIRTATKGPVAAGAEGDSLAKECYIWAKQAFCDFLDDNMSPPAAKRDSLKARLNRAKWENFTSWLDNDRWFISHVPPRTLNQYSHELQTSVPLDTQMDLLLDYLVLVHPLDGPVLLVSGVTLGVGEIAMYRKGPSSPGGVFDPGTRQTLLFLPSGLDQGLTLFTDATLLPGSDLTSIGNVFLYESSSGLIYRLWDMNLDGYPDQLSPPVSNAIPGEFLKFVFDEGASVPTITGYPFIDPARPAAWSGMPVLVLTDPSHDGYFEQQSVVPVDNRLLWTPTFDFDSVVEGGSTLRAYAMAGSYAQVWATDSTGAFNQFLGDLFGGGVEDAVTVPLSRPLVAGEEIVLVDNVFVPELLSPNFTVPSVSGVTPSPTVALLLHAPAPNPMSAETRIVFELPTTGRAEVAVYDLQGRRLVVLTDRVFEPGRHEVTWNGADAEGRSAAAGVYFVELRMDSERRTQRLIRVP